MSSYDAAPRTKSWPINRDGVYIEGKVLVVPPSYVFPSFCLVTGEAAELEQQRIRLHVVPLGAYLALVFNILAFFLVAAVLKQRADITVSMRRDVRRSYVFWRRFMWASLAGASFLPWLLVSLTDNGWSFLAFPILFFAAIAIYLTKVRIFYAEKISPSFVRIVGLKEDIILKVYEAGMA